IIRKFGNGYTAKIIAGGLGVSKQAVYKLKSKKEMKMKEKEFDPEIIEKIKELVRQYPQYGYRKIYAILRFRMGYKIYRNKVYKIMKSQKILLPSSTRNESLFKGVKMAMNLEAKRPNELWGIDMTYIWCGSDGWGYLHAVIDHYDKTLLGYHFSL